LNLDFTTKTWVNQSNVSVAYLSRLLREQTGKPASVHLRDKRLACAKELLAETDDLITSIAMASGFNDNNYFSRKFKECEGVSP
jgi:AraC-like DNA-binding protein